MCNSANPTAPQLVKIESLNYNELTFDQFNRTDTSAIEEAKFFNRWWLDQMECHQTYIFETIRKDTTHTSSPIIRQDGVVTNSAINFACYDYLGLSNDSIVHEAAKAALDKYGLSASSSPILNGLVEPHQTCETSLNKFLGEKDHAVALFPTGYSVNTGTITSVLGPDHLCIIDECAHSSIVEGARHSGARLLFFRHNNLDHMEGLLKKYSHKYSRKLVAVDALYSATGDYAPLKDIVSIAKRFDCLVLADEAHSMLIAGPNGRGVAAQEDVLDNIDFLIITMSKSFGGFGGALYARKEALKYVRWYSPERMFSCALPPMVAAGLETALSRSQDPDIVKRRKNLLKNSSIFRKRLNEAGFNTENSQSWIIPIVYGSEKKTLKLVDRLQRKGLHTNPMQYPAVRKGRARLRLFVSAMHEEEDFDRALEILKLEKSLIIEK